MSKKRTITLIGGITALLVIGYYAGRNESLQKAGNNGTPEKAASPAAANVLRMLVWEGYAPESVINEFEIEIEGKYGRKVTVVQQHITDYQEAYNLIRDKSVDLVTLSHYILKDERYNYIDKGLIIPPDLTRIPNYPSVMEKYRQAGYHTSKGIKFSVPVCHGPYGLAYNTGKFKQAPDSWRIFWDPEFKQRYSIGKHEYLYNIHITALALGYPAHAICFDTLNNDAFRERLKYLVQNAASLWAGVDSPEELRGLDFATSWGDLAALEEHGEKWLLTAPKEGTLGWVDDFALTSALKDKPFLKKVAEEWINTTLSVSYQVGHMVGVGGYSVTTNIMDKLTERERQRLRTAPDWMMLRIHSQRDRNGMKLLWDEAMKYAPAERTQ